MQSVQLFGGVERDHTLLKRSCLGHPGHSGGVPQCIVRLRRIVISIDLDLLITWEDVGVGHLDQSNYKVIIALSFPPLSVCLCNNPRRE